MKEFLLALMVGTLTTLEEAGLIAMFQKIHDNEPEEDYLLSLYAAKYLTKRLGKFANATKTTIDDAIVAEIGIAADKSAAANGVTLVGKTISLIAEPGL